MSKIFLWWESLNGVQSFFSYFAIPASILIILQTVLTLFGFIGENSSGGAPDTSSSGEFTIDDLPDGVDISDFPHGFDIDGDGIADIFPEDFDTLVAETSIDPKDTSISELITFRGIVAFLASAGWLVIGLIGVGVTDIISIVVGVGIGIIIMLLIGAALREIKKMDYLGNINLKNTIGLDGVAYLRIPKNLEGEGKVNVTVQGRFSEFLAITYWESDILTGDEIKVVSVKPGGRLVVEPKKPLRKIMEE